MPTSKGERSRDLVLYSGRRLFGLKLKELAAAVGLPNYGVVATNIKRYEQRLKSDRTEQSQILLRLFLRSRHPTQRQGKLAGLQLHQSAGTQPYQAQRAVYELFPGQHPAS